MGFKRFHIVTSLLLLISKQMLRLFRELRCGMQVNSNYIPLVILIPHAFKLHVPSKSLNPLQFYITQLWLLFRILMNIYANKKINYFCLLF